MGSRLEALIDRAERDLHDRYFDGDDEAEADDAREERRNMRLEAMADNDDWRAEAAAREAVCS